MHLFWFGDSCITVAFSDGLVYDASPMHVLHLHVAGEPVTSNSLHCGVATEQSVF